MSIKKKQGDSIWIDVTGDALSTVDEVWDNWTGSWAISTTIGATPTASGSMSKGPTIGTFKIRIGASVMENVAVGKYYLIVQVENSTVDYRQEIAQEKLEIVAQGIDP